MFTNKSSSISVSVVIPAFNHDKYISEAVESIFKNEYEPEIIIIDDGSTDNTFNECLLLKDKHNNIQTIKQSNQGAHNTLNIAIEKAKGNCIAILNSDDKFKPYKIDRCLNILRDQPHIDLIFGEVEFIDDLGKLLTKGISVDWQKRAYDFLILSNCLPLSVLNENFIATTSNFFFRKSLWAINGGFQPLRYCHDLEFLLMSFRQGNYYFDQHHTHIEYRIHPFNTIKESLNNIHIEIAAVIAASLVLDNFNLIESFNKRHLEYFRSFLKNKSLSELIILMMILFIKYNDREYYFKEIYKDENKALFSLFLN